MKIVSNFSFICISSLFYAVYYYSSQFATVLQGAESARAVIVPMNDLEFLLDVQNNLTNIATNINHKNRYGNRRNCVDYHGSVGWITNGNDDNSSGGGVTAEDDESSAESSESLLLPADSARRGSSDTCDSLSPSLLLPLESTTGKSSLLRLA